MKSSCDIILDLLPLVKDQVASEASIKMVLEHLEGCEECRREYESLAAPRATAVDDKSLVFTIKKKLFLAASALLMVGAFIGMALNKNTSSIFFPSLLILLSIIFVGVLLFKGDLKGDSTVKQFFLGKALGTIIVFCLLGVYLLLRYVLQLF